MAVRTAYAQGTPCWVDLSADDFAGAQRFYAELFDWQLDVGAEESGTYTMCRKDGRSVAGLMPHRGEDLPPTWSTYIASDDVDECAQLIRGHGGRIVMEPMDVLGAGRMCYAIDPVGATFGVWEAGEHVGAERVNEPGTLTWNELLTPDGAAADAFYRAVFGYEIQQLGDGADFDYTVWNIEGKAVCGRLHTGQGTAPQWMAYFAVDDCDKAAAKVADLGGAVLRDPTDSPYGRLAVVADPWRAQFTIMKLADPQR
jgi:predicted enzyme related to lactoylglutathione lyase